MNELLFDKLIDDYVNWWWANASGMVYQWFVSAGVVTK